MEEITESEAEEWALAHSAYTEPSDPSLSAISVIPVDSNGGVTMNELNITEFPREILDFTACKRICLARNTIASLPDDFFRKLPHLEWFDIRFNQLFYIPSAFLGEHEHLHTLLLGYNKLRTIPLELGLIKTIRNLNLFENPLEFPPEQAVCKGTRKLLRYLREVLEAKSARKISFEEAIDSLGIEDDLSDAEEELYEPDIWDIDRPSMIRSAPAKLSYTASGKSRSRRSSKRPQTQTIDEDLTGPMLTRATLNDHVLRSDILAHHMERLEEAKAMGTSRKKSTRSSRRIQTGSTRVDQGTNSIEWWSSVDPILQKTAELQDMERRKQIKMDQDKTIDRMNFADYVDKWREATKMMQQELKRKKMHYGFVDVIPAARKAPFPVDEDYMKMPSNEERMQEQASTYHSKVRAMSPNSRHRVEEERRQKEERLFRQIEEHTRNMVDRRKGPRGNPQEEMESALREIQQAEDLRRELMYTRMLAGYQTQSLGLNGTTVRRHQSKPK